MKRVYLSLFLITICNSVISGGYKKFVSASGVTITSTSTRLMFEFRDYETIFAGGQSLHGWSKSSKPKADFQDIDIITNSDDIELVRYEYEHGTLFALYNDGSMTVLQSLALGAVMIDSINHVAVTSNLDLYNKLNAIL